MEALNHLLGEFHQKQQSKNLIIDVKNVLNQYKAIYDELMGDQRIKKQIFRKRRSELYQIKKTNTLNNTSFSMLMPINETFHSSFFDSQKTLNSSINSQKLTLIEIEKQQLTAEIYQLERQIQSMKERKEQLLIENEILENEGKRCLEAGREYDLLTADAHSKLTQQITQNRLIDKAHEQKLYLLSQRKKLLATEVLQLGKIYQSEQETQKMLKKMSISVTPIISTKHHLNYEFSKSLFQESLRTFYFIKRLKQNWNQGTVFDKEIESSALISKSQIRLMNKIDIAQYYQTKGVKISEEISIQVIQFYESLINNFDRIERANNQINESYRSLSHQQQALNESLKRLNDKKQRNTIISLEKKQISIQNQAQKVNNICKIIFQFNIRFHGLLKKFTNFNKTFDKIIKSTHKNNRHLYRKTFIDVNKLFLSNFEMLLEKNPQDVLILWNKVTKQSGSGEKYVDFIMKNDLLRVHASPEMYFDQKQQLQNIQNTYNAVFQYQDNLIALLIDKLKGIISVPIEGIKYLEAQGKIEPLRNFQWTSTEYVPDTYFCVESKDYFRRDNYKLLQKLEKQELKRKGLLVSLPFSTNNQNQLEKYPETVVKQANFTSYRQLTQSFQNQKIKYATNLSTKREKSNIKQRELRKLFADLKSMAPSHSHRIQRKTQNMAILTSSRHRSPLQTLNVKMMSKKQL